jgi:hypothetical protein
LSFHFRIRSGICRAELDCRELAIRRVNSNDQTLDILLALDRSMVEFSMGLYNVPRRDRALMREQNRRLHRALRNRLPRLAE